LHVPISCPIFQLYLLDICNCFHDVSSFRLILTTFWVFCAISCTGSVQLLPDCIQTGISSFCDRVFHQNLDEFAHDYDSRTHCIPTGLLLVLSISLSLSLVSPPFRSVVTFGFACYCIGQNFLHEYRQPLYKVGAGYSFATHLICRISVF